MRATALRFWRLWNPFLISMDQSASKQKGVEWAYVEPKEELRGSLFWSVVQVGCRE